MSKFHFFTEIDLINPQVSQDAFGYISQANIGGILYDTFQVGSVHNSSVDAKLFMPCDGTICYQECIGNPNILNIIISPNSNNFIDMYGVKYLIIKGVKKNSLFNNLNNLLPIGTSNFIDRIWNKQIDYNTEYDLANNLPSGTTNLIPNIDSLGLTIKDHTGFLPNSLHLSNDSNIDLLFETSWETVTLPIAFSGETIGVLDKNYYSITIIKYTNYDVLNVNCSFLRELTSIIHVKALNINSTPGEIFENKFRKAQIINFIDFCSCLSISYKGILEIKNSLSVTLSSVGNKVYEDVVRLTNVAFINRNKVFIEFLDDMGYPVNCYSEYSEVIQIEMQGTLGTYSYSRNTWPILIIDNSEFPSGINTPEIDLIFQTNTLDPIRSKIIKYENFNSDVKNEYSNEILNLVTDNISQSVNFKIKSRNFLNGAGLTEIICNYISFRAISDFSENPTSQQLIRKDINFNFNVDLTCMLDISLTSDKLQFQPTFFNNFPFRNTNANIKFKYLIDEHNVYLVGLKDSAFDKSTNGKDDFYNFISTFDHDLSLTYFSDVIENDTITLNHYIKIKDKDTIFCLFSKVEFSAIVTLVNSTYDLKYPIYLNFSPLNLKGANTNTTTIFECSLSTQGIIFDVGTSNFKNEIVPLNLNKKLIHNYI